jgi:glycosyltransferase involved in cell wall biosynthesis
VTAGRTLRISVITPCLNRAGMIADALDSVRRQGVPDVEHIVIDGQSTDGTLEILRARSDIQLITGADANLYDAINKGLDRATGDIIALLNSDDRLADGALAIVRALFAANPDTPYVTGAMAIELGGGRRRVFDDPRFLRLRLADLISGPTLTNSRFLARGLVERVGRFDIRFPVVSDRDYLLRLRHIAPVGTTTPEVLYLYRAHAGSLTMGIEAADKALIAALAEAAELRAGETAGTAIGGDYARWAAWAKTRLALSSHGSAAETASRIAAAASYAPIGLLRQGFRHWSERALRLGRLIED